MGYYSKKNQSLSLGENMESLLKYMGKNIDGLISLVSGCLTFTEEEKPTMNNFKERETFKAIISDGFIGDSSVKEYPNWFKRAYKLANKPTDKFIKDKRYFICCSPDKLLPTIVSIKDALEADAVIITDSALAANEYSLDETQLIIRTFLKDIGAKEVSVNKLVSEWALNWN